MKNYTIALAGNPNSGKTTLFNAFTGSNQSIGNWPGVTVEKKEGRFRYDNRNFEVVDLPGIYSLHAHSEDEKVSRDYLLGNFADLVINIVDASNFERNMYLTLQLAEMGVPVIVVLNMIDVAGKEGISIDAHHLESHLGVPVFALSAIHSKEVVEFKKFLTEKIKSPTKMKLEVHYPNEIEECLIKWKDPLTLVAEKVGSNERWIGIKLIEHDPWISQIVFSETSLTEAYIEEGRKHIKTLLQDSPDVILTDYRYGVIHGISREVKKKEPLRKERTVTDAIDAVVMHPVWGIPIFMGIIFLVFWITISLGGAFIDFFDIFSGAIFVDGFAALLERLNAPVWIQTVLAGGLGTGLQTVATFIPIIGFMFITLSILEDSGYMARAAFIMDRFMRSLGLPGKAFVPMMVGFGCSVPAILATKTLDTKRDRIKTIFLVPLMSCGARLPVYALFAAAFFNQFRGLVVFSLYFIGILAAVITGLLLKKTIFKEEATDIIMELPRYHTPRGKHILLHTWFRLKNFIFRAGKVIIGAVFVLSLLSSFSFKGVVESEEDGSSILADIGKAFTPVFVPMGIEKENWPATVGLFTGIFAKEAIVGTLNSLYGQEELSKNSNGQAEEEELSFSQKMGEAFLSIPRNIGGLFGITGEHERTDPRLYSLLRQRFSPASAYAYLLFVLLYFPCVAAAAAAFREMGLGYGVLMVGYLTILAWSVATLFYQICVGADVLFLFIPLLIFMLIVFTFLFFGKSVEKKAQL